MDVRHEVQPIMWNNVLAFRDKSTLTTAVDKLAAIRAEKLPHLALASYTRTYNLEWMVALEAEFMVDVAEMIARAALAREESRGAHYRADFPAEDNESWLQNILIRQEAGEFKLEKRPAALTHVTLDQDTRGKEGVK